MNSGRGERVGCVVNVGGGRLDAVDGDDFQGVGIFLVVGVAEVTDGVGAAGDALDEDIVILG